MKKNKDVIEYLLVDEKLRPRRVCKRCSVESIAFRDLLCSVNISGKRKGQVPLLRLGSFIDCSDKIKGEFRSPSIPQLIIIPSTPFFTLLSKEQT
jgi:hypothetical protein